MTIPSDFWPAFSAIIAFFVAIGALVAFADSRIKGVANRESKARHDMKGEMTITLGQIENNMRSADLSHSSELKRICSELMTKHEALRDWAAPRVELREMENRFNEKISGLSSNFDRQMAELRSETRQVSAQLSGIGREIGGLTALISQGKNDRARAGD